MSAPYGHQQPQNFQPPVPQNQGISTAKLKILKHPLVPSTDPNRKGQTDMYVMYEDADGVRAVVRIPKENPTDQEIFAAIQQDYKHNTRLVGREVPVS